MVNRITGLVRMAIVRVGMGVWNAGGCHSGLWMGLPTVMEMRADTSEDVRSAFRILSVDSIN